MEDLCFELRRFNCQPWYAYGSKDKIDLYKQYLDCVYGEGHIVKCLSKEEEREIGYIEDEAIGRDSLETICRLVTAFNILPEKGDVDIGLGCCLRTAEARKVADDPYKFYLVNDGCAIGVNSLKEFIDLLDEDFFY